MDLVNKNVFHKILGKGKIISRKDEILIVSFNDIEKKFLFPDSFRFFLEMDDSDVNKWIQDILLTKNNEKKLNEVIEKKKSEGKREDSKIIKKIIKRANIAFKCNFCDGGQSSEQIGFDGVCCDKVIYNNIHIEKRTWCNSNDCPCLHYYNGKIGRKDLDDRYNNGELICYESLMLRDWKALAGIIQNGDRKGKPMKLQQVQTNSLCILTTRDPKSKENERYIFALFLVDNLYEGDKEEEGYVSTKSEFKIKLAPDEARSLKFWNYHSNENKSTIPAWSSGLHRYFKDIEAAQILKDVIKIKSGTKDEEISIRFFEHFCKINHVSIDELPNLFGALKIN